MPKYSAKNICTQYRQYRTLNLVQCSSAPSTAREVLKTDRSNPKKFKVLLYFLTRGHIQLNCVTHLLTLPHLLSTRLVKAHQKNQPQTYQEKTSIKKLNMLKEKQNPNVLQLQDIQILSALRAKIRQYSQGNCFYERTVFAETSCAVDRNRNSTSF